MIPSGKAHNEMLLNDYLGETGDIGSVIDEKGKMLVVIIMARRSSPSRTAAQIIAYGKLAPMPTLVIANKLYSSWSLRPWLLMKQLGIPFDEIVIPLGQPDTSARILKHSPAGRVPILIDGDATVWDSIAIIEYVAERFGQPRLAAGAEGAGAGPLDRRPRCTPASRPCAPPAR